MLFRKDILKVCEDIEFCSFSIQSRGNLYKMYRVYYLYLLELWIPSYKKFIVTGCVDVSV